MAAPPRSVHLTVNAVLMCVLGFGHLASVGSVVINVLGSALDWGPFARPKSEPELLGQMIAFAWMGLVAAIGVVWAPANAYALFSNKPWAVRSTKAYWVFLGVLCCCVPGAIYGFWSLSRAQAPKTDLDS